jgi:hypothetical protein
MTIQSNLEENSKITTNPSQAICGMLLSVWYGNLINDVTSSTKLSHTVGSLSLDQIKWCFIFASLVVIGIFAYMMTITIKTLYQDSAQISSGVVINQNIRRNIMKLYGVLVGFIATTIYLFGESINIYFPIFGLFIPIVWVVIEMYLIEMNQHQKGKTEKGNR